MFHPAGFDAFIIPFRCSRSQLNQRFLNVSLDYLADDEIDERGTRIYASAGHFDVNKLTPEGRERYEEYIEFLADKFTK